jgi:hypothetical protein
MPVELWHTRAAVRLLQLLHDAFRIAEDFEALFQLFWSLDFSAMMAMHSKRKAKEQEQDGEEANPGANAFVVVRHG